MGVSVNIKKAIEDYKQEGNKTKFENSLIQVLEYAKNDSNITSVSDLAYLLATAKAESDYSLQRWESDYACKSTGIPYVDKPCQSALNYYKSTKGSKQNYYNLGVDSKGLPYFGKGLIQLTGKANYKKYGDLINVDLVSNSEKALEPKNSYKIASIFLSNKRGGIYKKNGQNQNGFDLAKLGDLTLARKFVNGGSNGLSEVNKYYGIWKNILQKNLISEGKTEENTEENSKSSSSISAPSKKKKIIKIVASIGIAVVVLGVTGTLAYLYLKKRGNLPNFMKKLNL